MKELKLIARYVASISATGGWDVTWYFGAKSFFSSSFFMVQSIIAPEKY